MKYVKRRSPYSERLLRMWQTRFVEQLRMPAASSAARLMRLPEAKRSWLDVFEKFLKIALKKIPP